MAEHLTQDVDPRLAQSVVDSTTGADGATTLSNSHGVEVAAVVSGEEANSKPNPISSNGIFDGNTTNDASRTDKRDDSPTGASGTESTKSADKPTAQKLATSRKPPVLKSMSLNKAFLSGNASAPAQPGVGKLTLSLDKGSKVTGTGVAAASSLVAKPRLVSKIGPTGSRIGGIGQLGGKAGAIPSVWNRNLPPAPVPAKEYTDEELSKVGIHMAERLHTEDSKEAKWADIDDDDDNWVPPDTIEWNDGTKVTLDASEKPKPVVSAFEKQIGTVTQNEQKAAQPGPSPVLTSSVPQQLRQMDHHQFGKPDLIPSAPPPKTPWAAVPTGSFPTPRPIPPHGQQFSGRPLPPSGRQIFVNTQQQPGKEVAADDFSRSWRDRQSSQSPSTLFNSETGNFDPVGDGNRSRDQARRNSRAEAPGVRPTSLLQRGNGPEYDQQFQQNRFPGRPEYEQHPGTGMGGADMGRRRSASIRSAALSDTSSTTRDNRHPPANLNIATVSGGGTLDSQAQRANQGPLYISPTVAAGDPRLGRPGPQGGQGPQSPQAASQDLPPVPPPDGAENPGIIEAQSRLMKEGREQARARRLAEEQAAEEEKRKRIEKKLAELDEKMKAEAASKAKENADNEEAQKEAKTDQANGAGVDQSSLPPGQESSSSASTGAKSEVVTPAHSKPDLFNSRDAAVLNGSNGSNVNGGGSHHAPQPPPAPPGALNATATAATTTSTAPATHPRSPIQLHSPQQQHQQPAYVSHHAGPPTNISNPSASSSSPSSAFHHSQRSPTNRFSHPSHPYNNHHQSHQPPPPHHYPPFGNSSSNYAPGRFEQNNHRGSLQSATSYPDRPGYQSSTHPSDVAPPPPHLHQGQHESDNSQHHPPANHSQGATEKPQNMTAVFPPTRIGEHMTLSGMPLPPGKEHLFPVEVPNEWRRNGAVKASPWAPTAQETHVKRFSMFLPTPDKDKQSQDTAANPTWPVNGNAQASPAATAATAEPKAEPKVESKAEPDRPDMAAAAARYPDLQELGSNPRTCDTKVPGLATTTFKGLLWWKFSTRTAAGDPVLDAAFDKANAKLSQARAANKAAAPQNQETAANVSKLDTDEDPKPVEPPAKQLTAATISEQAKFDEVKNRILNLAGHTLVAKFQGESQAPKWREPPKRNFLGDWGYGGEKRYMAFRQRELVKHEQKVKAWHAEQAALKLATSAKQKPRVLSVIDPNLQVISKPAFQGTDDGKPKVSLPKPVVRAQILSPSKPELPNTLPTEEEFNMTAFQQEFGSTPTVCLPIVPPKPADDNAQGAQTAGKKGKDKKRYPLRDSDVSSKPIAFVDILDNPHVAPPIKVRVPGMTDARVFPMSTAYESAWKAQQPGPRNPRPSHHGEHRSGSHSQGARTDSGSSRSRHSGRRGQFNNAPR